MSLQPGERFGRYELESRLGHGGMAETWRARLVGDEGVTKPVLIKRVLPQYATDQAFTSMFISEARISATLSHGNIAQVYDFGRVDGEYFLAMEFVEGQPLNRIIQRALKAGLSCLPFPIAAFIAMEMCRGLHYAHTRKGSNGTPLDIVHRDISPDNVLVSYEGQVKIVDFGIAKARELREVSTEPGVVKGKYLFFSPEQARGEEVDGRTDVWATGVVLYEMLCGRLPAQGPEYIALPKLIQGEFPRPRALKPELSPELDSIVMRALAVDPAARFASSQAFGDALAGFLYSSTPRFSAESLSHLVQELFREELERQGHKVQVPASFVEHLSQWRGAPSSTDNDRPTTPMTPKAHTGPPETVAAPALRAAALATPADALASRVVATAPRVEAPPPPRRSSRGVVGALAGSALAVSLAYFAWPSSPTPPAAMKRLPLPPVTARPPEAKAPVPPREEPVEEARRPAPLPPSKEIPFPWIKASWDLSLAGAWAQDTSGHDHHGLMPLEGARGTMHGLEFLGTTGVVEIPDHEHFAIPAPITLKAESMRILSFTNERGIIYRRGDSRQEAISLETRPGELLRFTVMQLDGQARYIEGKLPPEAQSQFISVYAILNEAGEMRLYANCTLLARGRLTRRPLLQLDEALNPQISIGGVKGKPHGFHGVLGGLSLEHGEMKKSPKEPCAFSLTPVTHSGE